MDEWVKILPAEVWEMILENLKGDPETLLNCSETCQTWKELLEKDKADWLFPLVVPLLLEKYLSRNELLGCRRVSKKWKDGVDQFHQSAAQEWTPHIGDDMIHRVNRLERAGGGGSYQGRNVFTRTDELEAFHLQMADHPGNPFPSKSVIFRSLSHWWGWDGNRLVVDVPIIPILRGAAGTMLERLSTLLTTSGSHLSDFTYICGNLSFGIPLHVARVLETLPNLTSFSLVHWHPTIFPGVTSAKTLPVLRHLKCLRLRSDCYSTLATPREAEMVSTFNALLVAYGPQLETLDIDSEVFCAADYCNITDSQKLASLKHLKIRNIQKRPRSCLTWIECKLLNLQLLQLQRVSLHFQARRIRGDCGMIELWRLVRLLNHWSSTLIEAHLLVELPQLEMYSPFYSPEAAQRTQTEMEKQVPLLTVFGVCYSLLDSDMLLWFLNKFPKLERLELHGYHNGYISQGVNFSELVSEGESDDDEEEEESDSPPKVRRAHQELLDALWDVVPTLKDILVWDSAIPLPGAASPKRVFHWKRAERRRIINLCQ